MRGSPGYARDGDGPITRRVIAARRAARARQARRDEAEAKRVKAKWKADRKALKAVAKKG